MNKLTKPISSPEKFPPPLMTFLRSKSTSHRRGRTRSRATPMFIRKKNTIIDTTQEPSSPKVTCIGQVRIKRSNKNKNTTATTALRRRRHRQSNRLCRCLRNLKPTMCRSVWSKWVSFFRHGCCRNSDFLPDSPVIEITPKTGCRSVAGDNGEEQGLISRTTPRNAFLLTRCRSAPYQSASLARTFLELGMEKTGEEEIAKKIKNLKIETDEVIGVGNGIEDLKAFKGPPLILTRCKSEPARTGNKLLV